MLSSTSSSKSAELAWGVRTFLLGFLCVATTLEIATVFGVPLINRNQRRTRQEYDAARRLGQGSTRNTVSVLLLGNSLTRTDIDLDRLKADLGPGYQVARWAIDDTNYLDWYFGLLRLFREGARPHVVIVGGRTGHLLARGVRGNYFARHCLHRNDVLTAASRIKADPTKTSDMVFANVSAFYGCREEINKRLLTCMVPSFPRLARLIAKGTASAPEPPRTVIRISERLAELDAVCRANGTQLIVWMPPVNNSDEWETLTVHAGSRVEVPVLIPIRHNQIPASRFSDGFHLNAAGAIQLTEALTGQLRPLLPAQPARTHSRSISKALRSNRRAAAGDSAPL